MFPFGGLSSYVTGVNQHRLEPKPCHHSDWLSQLNQSKTGTQFSAQQVVLSCRSLNVAQRLHVVTAAFISSQCRKSNQACVVQHWGHVQMVCRAFIYVFVKLLTNGVSLLLVRLYSSSRVYFKMYN